MADLKRYEIEGWCRLHGKQRFAHKDGPKRPHPGFYTCILCGGKLAMPIGGMSYDIEKYQDGSLGMPGLAG